MHSADIFPCVNPEAHIYSNTYQQCFVTYLRGISNHKLLEDTQVSGPFPIMLQQASKLAWLMEVMRWLLAHQSCRNWQIIIMAYYHLSTMGWSLQGCSGSVAAILHIPAAKLSDASRFSYYRPLPNSPFRENYLNLEHTFSFTTQIHIYSLIGFDPFSRISLS